MKTYKIVFYKTAKFERLHFSLNSQIKIQKKFGDVSFSENGYVEIRMIIAWMIIAWIKCYKEVIIINI